MDYSTKRISDALFREIGEALRGLGYGSVKIYVEDHKVTQITKSIIKKTNNHELVKGKYAIDK